MTYPERPVCPPEVTEAVLTILREGLLSIRAAGSGDDAEFCADEANHLHNLPGMLRFFSWRRLKSYVTYVRQGYGPELLEHRGGIPKVYQEQWQVLETIYERHVAADTGEAAS